MDKIINSVIAYILTLDEQNGYLSTEIYNRWVVKEGIVISNPKDVMFILTFINDTMSIIKSAGKQAYQTPP